MIPLVNKSSIFTSSCSSTPRHIHQFYTGCDQFLAIFLKKLHSHTAILFLSFIWQVFIDKTPSCLLMITQQVLISLSSLFFTFQVLLVVPWWAEGLYDEFDLWYCSYLIFLDIFHFMGEFSPWHANIKTLTHTWRLPHEELQIIEYLEDFS